MERSHKKKMYAPLYGQVDERTKLVAMQGDAYMGRFTVFAVCAVAALVLVLTFQGN